MREASEQQAENLLSEALDMFRCSKDADIESFLREKAIEFEKRGFCTVYLILDEDAFNDGIISVQAYFTLSHKSIIFDAKVSKSLRGKIATHRNADMAHFVLIGQLGKYICADDTGKECATDISSESILNDAFDMISKASDTIVCRGVLVECSPEEKVHHIYENYGFTYLQNDDGHYQFYKRLRTY